ncbi:hypothetical protein QT976_18765 [Microcoleus sp. w2-18aC6]|uniref:hypothetical protein n=1 Tax=unclassified Microcoleus TaxID=2642155 RepID=UPI002FD0D8D4
MEKLFLCLGQPATFILIGFFSPFLVAATKYLCKKAGGWSTPLPGVFFHTPNNLKVSIFI